MSTPNFVLNQMQDSALQENIKKSAEQLGKQLRNAPEFQTFLEASRAANENEQVINLYNAIREHQSALQWGRGDIEEHRQQIKRLTAEFEALPLVQAYNRSLEEMHAFFVEVDEIISEAAGIPFAVNAKTSCCG